MQIIEFLQSFSNPVLDWFFRIITEAGDVTFFIVLGATVYWSVDKKFAFKMMVTFIFSAFVNGVIKNYTNKLRPYEEGAEPILQETTGSSMPSGHSQNFAVLSSFMIKEFYPVKWVRYLFISLAVLVPLSRLYLGQHYLEDVLVGLVLGAGFGVLGLYVFSKFDGKEGLISLGLIPIFIILMIIIQDEQLYVVGGAYIGLSLGYILENKYVKLDVKAKPLTQVLKIVVGLLVAFGLKEGLKPLFKLFGDQLIWVAIRYFVVAIWASLGAMALFKVFPKEKEKLAKQ